MKILDYILVPHEKYSLRLLYTAIIDLGHMACALY